MGGLRGILAFSARFWHFRRILAFFGDFWRFFVIFGGFWRFLEKFVEKMDRFVWFGGKAQFCMDGFGWFGGKAQFCMDGFGWFGGKAQFCMGLNGRLKVDWVEKRSGVEWMVRWNGLVCLRED